MIWYLFGLLFVLPFVDPRRPLRLMHLDLAALLVVGFGYVRGYLVGEQPEGSLILTLIGLGYLVLRLFSLGLRPSHREERLMPFLPLRWLAVAVVLLVGFRVGYVLLEPAPVSDVGVASVAGADRIGEGRGVYGEPLDAIFCTPSLSRCVGDTYGPVTYLFYVPFEQALPWHGGRRAWEAPSARAAALVFDLLTLAGLFALGARTRPGADGRLLGLALAYAWAAYPYSLFTLRFGFNDALVALLVLCPLLALHSAAGRGALTGLAAAAKFGPVLLAPLFAGATGERRLRSSLLFAAAFVAVTLAAFLPLLPDGGLPELYDRTVGYQQSRGGWNTLWARFPGLDWLQVVAQGGVVALSLLFGLAPRHKTVVQLAALSAGLLVALQLTMTYWLSTYVVWFAPLALLALFATYDRRDFRHARRAASG